MTSNSNTGSASEHDILEPVINAHIAKLDVIPYAKAIRLVLPNSRRYIKCVWHNVMNMHSRKRSPAKCQSIANPIADKKRSIPCF